MNNSFLKITALSLSIASIAAGQSGLYKAPDIKFFERDSASNSPGPPLATLSYRHEFSSDFDTLTGDVSVNDASVWAPPPPLQFGDISVLSFFGYRWTQFDTSANNLLSEDALQQLRIPVIALYEPADKWILGGMVMPSYSGDLSSSDNFSISAALGAGYKVNSKFTLFGGVYYTDGFDDSTIIPGIAFTWKPNESWEAYFLGPLLGVKYNVCDSWVLSLEGQYDSPTWHVEADSSGPDRDITMTSFRLGLKSEHKVGKFGWAYLSAGYIFAREVDIENLSSNTLQKDDIDSGAYLQTGFNLKF